MRFTRHYGSESDRGSGSEIGYPIPDVARTQPTVIEGGIQNIFRAMQTHGLIVADNGSDMYVSGTMDPRWNNDELNPAFRSSPRVISM